MIFQPPVDPFPDPVHAGQEIENIGLMFGSILLILVLIILMLYFFRHYKDYLPILVIYLFSLVIGMNSFIYGIPFTPYIQIFFILLQTSLILTTSLNYYNSKKV